MRNDQRRKLFAIGKKLDMGIDDLRWAATPYNKERKSSLRALSESEADRLIGDLQRLARQKREKRIRHADLRPDGNAWDYSLSGAWSQRDMMFDLMLRAEWDVWQFRAWLKRYHKVDHERFLNAGQRVRVIEGLKQIAARKKAKAER